MSDPQHVARHVKVYITVFIALLAGTLLTVTMYYLHFNSVAVTVTIALFIATVKASLVAGFFMHLVSERKAIYAIGSALAGIALLVYFKFVLRKLKNISYL